MGNIYIIQCANSYKIGKANNVKKRLAALQCGNPVKLKLVFEARVKRPYVVERRIHREFKDYRNLGEWFSLSDEQLRSACLMIDEYRPFSIEKFYFLNPDI